MHLTQGTVIGGRYRIDDNLGEGGMATVYKAFDTRLERFVALKDLVERRGDHKPAPKGRKNASPEKESTPTLTGSLPIAAPKHAEPTAQRAVVTPPPGGTRKRRWLLPLGILAGLLVTCALLLAVVIGAKLLLTGDATATVPAAAVLEDTITPTPSPSPSPSPTHTQQPTVTTTLSPTPTVVLPVSAGTALPLSMEAIQLQNIKRIRPVAHWGEGSLSNTVFLPDGSALLAADGSGIHFYDTSTWEESRMIESMEPIKAIALSGDGSQLFGISDYFIFSWDIQSGILASAVNSGLSYPILQMALSPDRKQIALLNFDNQVTLLDPLNGMKLPPYALPVDTPIRKIQYSPDGTYFAALTSHWTDDTGCVDCAVRVWQTSDQQQVFSYPSGVPLNDMVFSNDSDLITAADGYGQLFTWKFKTNTLIWQSKPDYQPLNLLYSPDNRLLFSTYRSDEGMGFYLIDAMNGTIINQVANSIPDQNFLGFAFSPDSQYLAAVSDENVIQISSIPELTVKASIGHPHLPANSLAFAPDGSSIYILTTNAWRGSVLQVESANGSLIRQFDQDGALSSLAISPDGSMLAAARNDDPGYKHLILWDTAAGSLRWDEYLEYAINTITFMPDNQTMLVGSSSYGQDGSWYAGQFRKAQDGSLNGVFKGNPSTEYPSLNLLVYAPDGSLFATDAGQGGGLIYLYDAQFNLLASLSQHTANLTDLAFSPDSRFLASSSRDDTVLIWQVDSSGETLINTITPQETILKLAYSSDGGLLAGASYSRIYLWDTASWELLYGLDESTSGITEIAFSPDGSLLAELRYNGILRLWGVIGN